MAETSKVGSNIMYICSNLVCKIPGVSAHPKKNFFEPLFFVRKGTNYYSLKKNMKYDVFVFAPMICVC